jgi:hypothetical protein
MSDTEAPNKTVELHEPDPKTEQEFYAALGYALSRWQKVEMELFRVYERVVGTASLASRAAFHSIINFNSRLGMTNAAAEISLANTPQLDEWRALSKELDKMVRKRNILAHFVVVQRFSITAKHGPDPRNGELFLQPSFYDLKNNLTMSEQQRKAYDLKYLQSVAVCFEELKLKVFNFWIKLAQAKT